MEITVESTVGPYKILALLGEGGMGCVFKARHEISQAIVALKLVHSPDNADLSSRFLREVKITAQLEHPNIPRLLSAERIDGRVVMAVEFVEGVTLAQRMSQRRLTIHESVGYVKQILSALHYAHKLGVVHRDIKPANVMIERGIVKLLDFGLAKAAAVGCCLTRTGTTLGSVHYMAPEQILHPSSVDARADLYAVGITLYELLTGARPFDGASDYAIMSGHLNDVPRAPIDVDPDLPISLSRVVMKAIAKDPASRFQTAAELNEALSPSVLRMAAPRASAHTAGQPVPGLADSVADVKPPAPLPAAVKPQPRPDKRAPAQLFLRARWWIAASACAGMLLFAAAACLWRPKPASAARPVAPVLADVSMPPAPRVLGNLDRSLAEQPGPAQAAGSPAPSPAVQPGPAAPAPRRPWPGLPVPPQKPGIVRALDPVPNLAPAAHGPQPGWWATRPEPSRLPAAPRSVHFDGGVMTLFADRLAIHNKQYREVSLALDSMEHLCESKSRSCEIKAGALKVRVKHVTDYEYLIDYLNRAKK